MTTPQMVEIDYTNHRGERAIRRIMPGRIAWKSNEWHPEPQWLLFAYDWDKNAYRWFALAGIHSWGALGSRGGSSSHRALLSALRPFVVLVPHMDGDPDDRIMLHFHATTPDEAPISLTVGDFRALAKLAEAADAGA